MSSLGEQYVEWVFKLVLKLYHFILSFPFRSSFLLMQQEKRETRKHEITHFYFLRIGLETVNSDISTHLLLKLFQFFVVIPCKIKMRKKSIAVIAAITDFDTQTKLTSHFPMYRPINPRVHVAVNNRSFACRLNCDSSYYVQLENSSRKIRALIG